MHMQVVVAVVSGGEEVVAKILETLSPTVSQPSLTSSRCQEIVDAATLVDA